MTPSPLLGVAGVLDALGRVGGVLTAEGGRLRCSAPTGAMTPDLLAALRRHKGELIARLSAAAGECADAEVVPPAPAEDVDAQRDALEERAAILEHKRGRPLPPPLVLRDGRRLWRILAGRSGQATEAAAALVAEAKGARVVTVADNAVLLICVPAGYRGDLPERLAAARADVLAVLHRQSDERIAAASTSSKA